MTTIQEAQEEILLQKQLIEQRRQESNEAEKQLEEARQSLPNVNNQRSLRQRFSGLMGRKQRQQIQSISENIEGKKLEVKDYKTQLSEYEQSLKPVEQEIQQIEKQQGAYDVLSGEIKKTVDEFEGEYTSAKSISKVREAFQEAGLDPNEGENLYKQYSISGGGRQSLYSDAGEFLGTYDVSSGKVNPSKEYTFGGFDSGGFTFTKKQSDVLSGIRSEVPRSVAKDIQTDVVDVQVPKFGMTGLVSADTNIQYQTLAPSNLFVEPKKTMLQQLTTPRDVYGREIIMSQEGTTISGIKEGLKNFGTAVVDRVKASEFEMRQSFEVRPASDTLDLGLRGGSVFTYNLLGLEGLKKSSGGEIKVPENVRNFQSNIFSPLREEKVMSYRNPIKENVYGKLSPSNLEKNRQERELFYNSPQGKEFKQTAGFLSLGLLSAPTGIVRSATGSVVRSASAYEIELASAKNQAERIKMLEGLDKSAQTYGLSLPSATENIVVNKGFNYLGLGKVEGGKEKQFVIDTLNDLTYNGKIKNLPSSLSDVGIYSQGSETYLPKKLDLFVGQIGDIKKTVDLPELSYYGGKPITDSKVKILSLTKETNKGKKGIGIVYRDTEKGRSVLGVATIKGGKKGFERITFFENTARRSKKITDVKYFDLLPEEIERAYLYQERGIKRIESMKGWRLEKQVVEPVKKLNNKGFVTSQSGTFGNDLKTSFIDVDVLLTEKEIQLAKNVGLKIRYPPRDAITFAKNQLVAEGTFPEQTKKFLDFSNKVESRMGNLELIEGVPKKENMIFKEEFFPIGIKSQEMIVKLSKPTRKQLDGKVLRSYTGETGEIFIPRERAFPEDIFKELKRKNPTKAEYERSLKISKEQIYDIIEPLSIETRMNVKTLNKNNLIGVDMKAITEGSFQQAGKGIPINKNSFFVKEDSNLIITGNKKSSNEFLGDLPKLEQKQVSILEEKQISPLNIKTKPLKPTKPKTKTENIKSQSSINQYGIVGVSVGVGSGVVGGVSDRPSSDFLPNFGRGFQDNLLFETQKGSALTGNTIKDFSSQDTQLLGLQSKSDTGLKTNERLKLFEATNQTQREVQQQPQKEISVQNFRELLKLQIKEVSESKSVSKSSTPLIREPIKPKTPFRPIKKKSKLKKKSSLEQFQDLYGFYVKEKGQDIFTEGFKTQSQAEEEFSKVIKGTLRAGGGITKSGEKIKSNLLGLVPSKRDEFRLIEPKQRRIKRGSGEVFEIQRAKGKKTKWRF